MSRFITLVALTAVSHIAFCQAINDKYPSKDEKNYYRLRPYQGFKPETISSVRDIHYEHITVRSEDTRNPFKTVWELTPFMEFWDSLEQICCSNLLKIMGTPEERHLNWEPGRFLRYYDSLEKLGIPKLSERSGYKEAELKCDRCTDSVKRLFPLKQFAGIEDDMILRHDSLGTRRILLYRNPGLTEFDFCYWIAISLDGGKSWKKYYSGLVDNNFFHIKSKSKIKLIKNDSTIQIEVAIVRQVEGPALPVIPGKYELVDDNRIIDINLLKVMADSDGDGLTDLFEKRLLTNPLSKDTDADGIADAMDNNPRFRSVKNKYSNLFLFFLESGTNRDAFIPFDNYKPETEGPPKTQVSTYFVVTEDPNLMKVGKTLDTFIFLSSKDLIKYKKLNQGSMHELYVSPLFKVDGKHRTWKIHIGGNFWRHEYLLIEQQKGWLVKSISASIS